MNEPAPASEAPPLLAVFTTTASRDAALALAEAAVSRGLAACVQLSAIDSVYVWQGALQREAECRVMFKTVAARYPALQALIRERHAYELPAIYALPVAQADEAYARWVRDATAPGP